MSGGKGRAPTAQGELHRTCGAAGGAAILAAPMGMADIATMLFKEFMRFDAADPQFLIDRDWFIGHGSTSRCSLLYLPAIRTCRLRRGRRKTATAPRQPPRGDEFQQGQGVAEAVGMALSERITEMRVAMHWSTTTPTPLWGWMLCLMEWPGISEAGPADRLLEPNPSVSWSASKLCQADTVLEIERPRQDGRDSGDAIVYGRSATDLPQDHRLRLPDEGRDSDRPGGGGQSPARADPGLELSPLLLSGRAAAPRAPRRASAGPSG